MKRVLTWLFLVYSITATAVRAQAPANIAKGFAPDKVFDFHDVDHINLYNGSLNIALPIGQSFHVNGPLSYGLSLSYSGNNWLQRTNNYRWFSQTTGWHDLYKHFSVAYGDGSIEGWNSGLGWRLSVGGELLPYGMNPDGCACYEYQSPDGGLHSFYPTLHPLSSMDPVEDQHNEPATQYTTDGTYIRMLRVLGTKMVNGQPISVYFRDLEFPDGTIRRFPDEGGVMAEMRDRFGNKVTVDSTPANGLPHRVISDGTRTQTISFVRIPVVTDPDIQTPAETAGGDIAYYDVVKTVTMSGFAGTPSVFTFHYGNGASDAATTLSRPIADNQDCAVEATVQLAMLTSVDLADGSSWKMSYDTGDGGISYSSAYTPQTPAPPQHPSICDSGSLTELPGFSGNLKSLTLPTGGAIRWNYGRNVFPPELYTTGHPVATGVGYMGGDKLQHSVGVTQRTEENAAQQLISKRTYNTRYYAAYPNLEHTSITTVKTWTGFNPDGSNGSVFSRSVNYFSISNSMNNIGTERREFGLPLTRYATDPENGTPQFGRAPETDPVTSTDTLRDGRYLSTKLYDKDNHLVRATYVRYEGDAEMINGQSFNRRPASDAIVDFDQSGGVTTVATSDSSDYDGLGHYRTTTVSGTGFPGRTSRTVTTNYNKPDSLAGPGYNSGTYTNNESAFNEPNIELPWILDTYSSKTVSDGSTSRKSVFCFDPDSGFLNRSRITANGVGFSTGDVLTRFTGDGHGNVASEESFGGDLQVLRTDALCGSEITAVGASTLPRYRVDHLYSAGSLSKSAFVDGIGSDILITADNTIDANTGLPSIARDSAGLATTFSYDTSGRLVLSQPDNAVIARSAVSVITYTNASTSGPASVLVKQVNAANSTVTQNRYEFDSLGRLWKSFRLMPSGNWSVTETLYDSSGLKATESSLESSSATTHHYTTFTWDVLGRPRTIQSPDTTLLSYAYPDSSRTDRTTQISTAAGAADSNVVVHERYDRFGKLVSVDEPADQTSSTQTTGGSVVTQYTYDIDDHLTGVAMPNNGVVQHRSFAYDGRGFLLSETHPELGSAGNGSTAYSSFDAHGHAGSVITGSAGGHFDLALTYDLAGRLTKIEDLDPVNASRRTVKSFVFATANDPIT
ncbi:MAG: hypothetical protein JWO97_2168, partial [Acidobacteria bacterium]|nr:hypothetical protein [Acidobacteriota bacterium]